MKLFYNFLFLWGVSVCLLVGICLPLSLLPQSFLIAGGGALFVGVVVGLGLLLINNGWERTVSVLLGGFMALFVGVFALKIGAMDNNPIGILSLVTAIGLAGFASAEWVTDPAKRT